MKKIQQLQTLLNLVLWFSMAIIGIVITAVVYGVATQSASKLNFTMHGLKIDTFDPSTILLIFFTLIGYSFFIAALYQLKVLVSLFVDRHFFTAATVKALRRIGAFLMVAALLMIIPVFLYESFRSGNADIRISSVGPESFFFLIIISLFFTTLSYIFKEAMRLQEENELTI